MGGVALGDERDDLADARELLVHVFHVAQRLGDAGFEVALVDKVFGEDLAVLVRDDFEAALAHERIVHVVELGALADDGGLVELDFHACAVAHPGHLADGAHGVPADDHRVFGLQRAELREVDIGLVGHLLVRLEHAVGDAREQPE